MTVILAAAVVLLAVSDTASQSLQIAIVDLYGLRRVSAAQARSALTIKEGDTVVIAGDARPAFATESERRLAMLPGVLRAHVAMRALAVIARAAAAAPQRMPIPIKPFIGLLDSPVWTDRNKASLALMSLSERRDPALLTTLRHRALGPLVEMARWQSRGHARPALLILGRIAGQSDEDVEAAWTRGDRDAVINAALARR